MLRRVDIVLTDVSEERTASIFRVEEKRIKSASEKPARAGASLWTPARAGSSLVDFLFSSTLKMEAISSSETSVNTLYTRHNIPEDCFLHSQSRENLNSYIDINIWEQLCFAHRVKNEGKGLKFVTGR
jgi:hypothetical protein